MNDETRTQPSKELGRLAGLFLWVVFLGVFAGTFVGVMNLGISFLHSTTGKTYVLGILHPGRKAELQKLTEDLDAFNYERSLRHSMLHQLQHEKSDTAVSDITSINNIKEELVKLDVSIHRLEYKIGKRLGIPEMTALDSYRQSAPCTET